MRLFLGLELPQAVKTKIETYLAPIKLTNKGWESSHDYHQTLLFIGEIENDEVEKIKKRMEQIHFPSFILKPTSFQFFNRRVMYLGIQNDSVLLRLKNLIDHKFPEFCQKETKPFLPHITVKRWQRYEYAYLAQKLNQNPWMMEDFRVDSLCLFKSEKDAQYHKYHVIFRVPFDNSNEEYLKVQSNL
jgi:2'-5' RNA ligase